MSAPLHLLVIEDDPADYLLLTRHLRKHGLAAECTRVADTSELASALQARPWEAVLADYYLPGMDFEPTLDLIRGLRPDLPLILVSGAVGEERAVELLRRGVCDFVLKDHLARLVPAIERCLREAAESRGRQAAEAKLRESEERLRLALDGGDLGMWDWNVETETLIMNTRWAGMLGYDLSEIPPSRAGWAALVHPDDLAALREAFAALLEDRLPVFQIEHRLQHQDGGWVWVYSRGKVIGRDPNGWPLRVCGTHQDISERKRLEQELRHLAVTDQLTGAFNRRHLMETLDAESRRARRYARPLALIMFDLDCFKVINDTYGHDQGDAALVATAASVGQRLRHSDILARWGGEEFMVLLPETALTEAAALAESLRQALPAVLGLGQARITASFGVAEYNPAESLDQWLKRVDDLMYRAKAAGRDQVAWGPA